jgi:hypothetical protein
MRLISILAAAAVLSVPAAAAAGDKPGQPKTKKVCTVIEPAVGRLPAKRVCETRVVAPAQPQAAQGEAAAAPAAAADPSGHAN